MFVLELVTLIGTVYISYKVGKIEESINNQNNSGKTETKKDDEIDKSKSKSNSLSDTEVVNIEEQ